MANIPAIGPELGSIGRQILPGGCARPLFVGVENGR
jgi:hypothetical protein